MNAPNSVIDCCALGGLVSSGSFLFGAASQEVLPAKKNMKAVFVPKAVFSLGDNN